MHPCSLAVLLLSAGLDRKLGLGPDLDQRSRFLLDSALFEWPCCFQIQRKADYNDQHEIFLISQVAQ